MSMMVVITRFEDIAVGGAVATALLTTVLSGSQGFGLSRLSLPFLVGTLFTANRARANLYGAIFYFLGGWIFAALYFWIFAHIGMGNIFIGAITGMVHALFLLTAVLPLLPYIHPRVASEYDAPGTAPKLEPPGFLGLHYGHRTPLSTLIGHAIYGATLGIFYGGFT